MSNQDWDNYVYVETFDDYYCDSCGFKVQSSVTKHREYGFTMDGDCFCINCMNGAKTKVPGLLGKELNPFGVKINKKIVYFKKNIILP
jgi:hypothetical protein